MKIPSIFCKKMEQKSLKEEKYILRKYFCFPKKQINRFIIKFSSKTPLQKYSLLFEKNNSIEIFNILLKLILFLCL